MEESSCAKLPCRSFECSWHGRVHDSGSRSIWTEFVIRVALISGGKQGPSHLLPLSTVMTAHMLQHHETITRLDDDWKLVGFQREDPWCRN